MRLAIRYILCVVAVVSVCVCHPGPQHWGFGFSYLAALEELAGQRRLVVYEPPLRAKDGVWLSRWIDRTTSFEDVPVGGLTVGNFWPSSFGTDHLAVVRLVGGQVIVHVYEPPQCFAVRQWSQKSVSNAASISGNFLGATAGNPRASAKDQLLIASEYNGNIRISMLNPPTSPTGTTWSKLAEADLPNVQGSFVAFACGDFWGEKKDYIALATLVGGKTRIAFYRYDVTGNRFDFVVDDRASDLPALVPGGLCAADYQKDGFDVLTMVPPFGGYQLRVAPALPGRKYDDGPQYDGKALSGQWMPGNGGYGSRKVMTGFFGAEAGNRLAFGAGRLFGYINTDLNSRYSISSAADAQISFARRSPRKDERAPYGWPAYGETVSYEINLQNTGASTIPGGSVRLKVWVDRDYRNADTDPVTCDTPDYDLLIGEDIPAYDANSPTYVSRTVTLTWPYQLILAGPRATWRKINVEDLGERWVIAVLEWAGDGNQRNNRYEFAIHGLTFHPIFRSQASLADRQPTVLGDPPSKEYLSRKLADAVQCMWERSATRDGQDVLQRLWFDSYAIGWPSDSANPSEAWQIVQAKYEGWRELDGWWGHYQGWERFNWGDGGAELHETGHLFHPLGDLYQYYTHPVFTSASSMADGTPVQIASWCWGADSFGPGQTKISWPACEMMRRFLVGARNNGISGWESLAPDRTWVRVLDRDGRPVEGAEVKLWLYGSNTPIASGTTGADGRWEITSLFGSYTLDAFGRKHYTQNQSLIHSLAQVFTVRIGQHYHDATIWGIEDTASHSRHTYMGHSMVHEAGWTWDFRTNYRATAAPPDFTVTAAVEGRKVSLEVAGPLNATYRVYRRWQPTFVRTVVGDYTATGSTVRIVQDMAEADSFDSNRFRTMYEVTRIIGTAPATPGGVQDAIESLPRSVFVTGLSNACGISDDGQGRLLVASNAGIANPFCQLFDGTTPYRELSYHFRFGHTAQKVVASKLTTGKYYATLQFADMTPEYRFDLVTPPTSAPYGYDVRNDIQPYQASSFSKTAPYWIQKSQAATRYLPGDLVIGTAASSRVNAVSGNRIYTDALVFNQSDTNPWFSGSRLAGYAGTDSARRELQSARGLTVFLRSGVEYVAIADTGNRRLVVWDASTKYVTHYQFEDAGAKPAAVAAHPLAQGKVYVLDRGTNRLYRFTFDGSSLTVDPGFPVSLVAGDWSGGKEIGLAAASPDGSTVLLAVTNASSKVVREYNEQGTVLATYNAPTGNYMGNATLDAPSDVAYVTRDGRLSLYAVDGLDRVVLLAQRLVLGVPSLGGTAVAAEFASGSLKPIRLLVLDTRETEAPAGRDLVERYTAALFEASHGTIEYRVTEYAQSESSTLLELLQRARVAKAINDGEADEVLVLARRDFLATGAYMFGNHAIALDYPPYTRAPFRRTFVVTVADIEQGLGGLLATFCRRAEKLLTRAYGSWNGYPPQHDWDRFTLYEGIAPGQAACGTLSQPPGETTVLSSSDDWLHNWPNLRGTRRALGPEDWGSGNPVAHAEWWLSHLPHAAGRDAAGMPLNWWSHIVLPSPVPSEAHR